MKFVLFGGSGTLGAELKKLNPVILCPKREDVDVTNFEEVNSYISEVKPDIVINAAAVTDNRKVERFPIDAINTNIIGSANVSMACQNVRLVYISTDYIYKGDRGNYKETDEILPFNLYSWTKLGGECSTVSVKNHLIIRTSFGKNKFEYSEAFTDKWTSKDYVDRIAPLIYEAAISPLTGVLNLGTERKTLFAHASERAEVKGVKLEDTDYFTPYDTSLNLQKWTNYKGDKSIAKPHCACRVCGGTNLTKYLDLGLMPLANNLEFTAQRAKNKERFPLQVLFCEYCSLSQLSVVIDPEKMFSYYTYRSSVNGGYIKHCRKMAKELKERFSLNEESFMIDIAGNDGTLLNQFRDEVGLKVLNIDPATNLVAIAESLGIESVADFWGEKVSRSVLESHGKADLITATNVFAHVDNVRDFIKSAKILLKADGVLVLEFPYLVDFIENYEFDTIYFEHLSYFSIIPLRKLCNDSDLKIISVEKQNIHGGTVRVTISHSDSSHKVEDSVSKFIENEFKLGYNTIGKYKDWAIVVSGIIDDFSTRLLILKKQGYKIAGFAASAKGNTLLNSASVNTDIVKYIADETPEKIGKYSPGTGIPIVNKQQLIKDPPDYVIILSWNFKDEIIEKLNKIYNGKYIVPIELLYEKEEKETKV
jgi:dTDP-4-dehydrorhamnose reductase/SAM-dependent methyltransferase